MVYVWIILAGLLWAFMHWEHEGEYELVIDED